MRAAIRVRHYSIRAEEAYVHWVRRFVLFHGKRHPLQMGEREVVAFLSDLALVGRVAPATQNQALNALVFLYGAVLERPLGDVAGVVRAKPRPPPICWSGVRTSARCRRDWATAISGPRSSVRMSSSAAVWP